MNYEHYQSWVEYLDDYSTILTYTMCLFSLYLGVRYDRLRYKLDNAESNLDTLRAKIGHHDDLLQAVIDKTCNSNNRHS